MQSTKFYQRWLLILSSPLMNKKRFLILESQGRIAANIARIIQRSPNSVHRFLKDAENYGKRRSPDRLRKLDYHCERRIYDKVSRTSLAVYKVRRNLRLHVSRHTVWRAIRRSHRFQYRKCSKTSTSRSTTKTKEWNGALKKDVLIGSGKLSSS